MFIKKIANIIYEKDTASENTNITVKTHSDNRVLWTGKANENPHYAPYSDNDEGTEYGKRGNEQYTISSDEIKNTNDREIADTFVVPDEFKMDLHKILGF